MAERRMFAKTIIDSDAFLDMPLSAQSLYFHMSMRADDDGFINNPKRVQRMIGASDSDYETLIAKNFIIQFNSGVCVIKHWRINNYIQGDRYKPTVYSEEKSKLSIKENKAYTLMDTECIQDVYNLDTQCIQNVHNPDTQVSIGKVSIVKDSIDEVSIAEDTEEQPAPEKPPKPSKHKYGEYKHILLTDEEYMKLLKEYGEDETVKAIEFFDAYIEEKGYKGKSHYLAMRRWVFNAVAEQEQRKVKTQVGGNITNKVAQQLDSFYNMADEWAKSYAEG